MPVMKNPALPDFFVEISSNCSFCRRCLKECSFRALKEKNDHIITENILCTGCQRCAVYCPQGAIRPQPYPHTSPYHATWTPAIKKHIWKQAETGSKLLTAAGTDCPYPVYWDHLLLDACQITNPSIDPLREPMELRTYLGRKQDQILLDAEGKLKNPLPPQLKLDIPVLIGAMSFGAVSLNVHHALVNAAVQQGTVMNCGEGGLHPSMEPFCRNIIVQIASGRFGINPAYLEGGAAIEIKMGQGAKPGIGGHLPGEKVGKEIAAARKIPEGSDAISPAPHHDIYSIEDLAQLINALKEATRYRKPVGVKMAAVHNIAAIASGAVRAGADFLTIDGFRGGTGATPLTIRDNMGIPVEFALAAVDDRLREEGIRNEASLVVSGSIRSSADVLKAIALGADAVAIGTAALIALGCTLCQKCYSNQCAWGITTQDPELSSRVSREEGGQKVASLLQSWSLEIKEMLGALGLTSIEGLRGNRERLRGIGLESVSLETLGVKPVGR